MNAILTDDELIELTGSKLKSKQRRVLQGYGVKFFTRPDGKPAVPVAALSAALSLPSQAGQAAVDDGFNLGM